MTTQEEIEFTSTVLTNLLRDNKVRLLRSLQLRDQIHQALEAGDQSHYRVAFIKDGVSRILDTLEAIARDFNAKHPDDICTAKDFGDILLSTIRTLQSVGGG